MTIKRVVSTLFLAAVLATSTAYAHDPSQHKGKPVKGQIGSVTNDGFDLVVDGQTLKVTLTSKTKIEHGNQVVPKDHLQKGSTVSVFGTKLPSGEMVAREVVIGGGEHEKHTDPTKGGSAKKQDEHKKH